MSSSSNLRVYDFGVRHRYNLHAYIVHACACRLPSRQSTLCNSHATRPTILGTAEIFKYSQLFFERQKMHVRLFFCIKKDSFGVH